MCASYVCWELASIIQERGLSRSSTRSISWNDRGILNTAHSWLGWLDTGARHSYDSGNPHDYFGQVFHRFSMTTQRTTIESLLHWGLTDFSMNNHTDDAEWLWESPTTFLNVLFMYMIMIYDYLSWLWYMIYDYIVFALYMIILLGWS